MVILGIDPGSVVTGYGVLEGRDRKHRLVTCGCIRPDSKLPFARRLLEIYDSLLELIADVAPDEVALEAVFYGANVQTMMKMCHARGVIMLALANSGLPIFEYAPREIKKAVVGRGGASKEQVQFMVHSIFGMEGSPETYDVTDGVAVALCHAHRREGALCGEGRRKNDLESKLRAAGAYDRRSDRLHEKLEAMGVAPAPRHLQVKPKRRGR